jgi:hypothetical protein
MKGLYRRVPVLGDWSKAAWGIRIPCVSFNDADWLEVDGRYTQCPRDMRLASERRRKQDGLSDSLEGAPKSMESPTLPKILGATAT